MENQAIGSKKEDITYFSLKETIAEVMATLIYGEGLHFKSKSQHLNDWFKRMRQTNKFDQLIWRVLREQSLNGHAGIKFDALVGPDVRLSQLTNYSYTRALNEIIYADLIYFPFQMMGNRKFDYRVREVWHMDKIIRYFYYRNDILTFSMFLAKIPHKFRLPAMSNMVKGFSGIEPRAAAQGVDVEHEILNAGGIMPHPEPYNNNYFYYTNNNLKMIPIVIFENLTLKPDLDENNEWDRLINAFFAEILYDLKLSRPVLKVTTLSKDMRNWIAEVGFPPGVFVETKTVPQATDLTPVAAKARFNELTQTLEKLIILAFNQANLSYVSQLGTTSAKTEEIKQSYGAKTVQMKRIIFNNDLKILFDKILKAVFPSEQFEYEIELRKPFDEEKQIQAVAQAKAFGLIDKAKAIEQINNSDAKKTEEIEQKTEEDLKKQQESMETYSKVDSGDQRDKTDNQRIEATPKAAVKSSDSA